MIKRGELYYADLNPIVGSEQGGVRPVVIIQNDVGNRFSPTVIVAAITTSKMKNRLPTHIPLRAAASGLKEDSTVLMEQIRTIDKSRLMGRIGQIDPGTLARINSALAISIGK